jgi:hypothetical protein
MTIPGRVWSVLTTLVRIDMAAGITIAAALLLLLAWHGR